jgi:hypothetical protein
VTACFRLQLPEIFSLSGAEYAALHQSWIKALGLLPPGAIMQKQDWFRRAVYRAGATKQDPDLAQCQAPAQDQDKGQVNGALPEEDFILESTERFFNERPYLDHECLVFITLPPASIAAGGLTALKPAPARSAAARLVKKSILNGHLVSGAVAAKNYQLLEETISKFSAVLTDSGIVQIKRLKAEEITGSEGRAGVLEQYLFLLGADASGSVDTHVKTKSTAGIVAAGDRGCAQLRDILLKPEWRIGDLSPELFTLADAQHLPATCGPRINYQPYATDKTRFSVGFAAPLGLLLPVPHLYSQYIKIQDSPATFKRLEAKRKRLQSLSAYSRENSMAKEAVAGYLNEAIADNRRPVKAHFNLLTWAGDSSSGKINRSKIITAISQIGAIPYQESVAAPAVWWAGIPGNGQALPDNECFDSFLEQASCFLNMESVYRSSKSTFGIRMGDRLSGLPIHVDISDEPMKKGVITNRNKIVVGGSGSGKSMFMNHLLHSYVRQGAHCIVVDVGHSYEGLCKLLKGYYFTYTRQKPIAFNPFYMSRYDVVPGEGEAHGVEHSERHGKDYKQQRIQLGKDADNDNDNRDQHQDYRHQNYKGANKKAVFSEPEPGLGLEPDTEKKESIKTLLVALWKQGDESFRRSEYVAISSALTGYYAYLEKENGDVNRKEKIFPCFDSFYEYLETVFVDVLQKDGVKDRDFDMHNFLYVLRPYYKGGEFDYLLNARENLDLMDQPFIVFELDNIKDHPVLFPVITLIIMEMFISKMRRLKGIRKVIVIEEAWKAIARSGMAEFMKYLYKTVRKHYGEAVTVTQEIDDIISSPIIKEAIINNADCKILLDMKKFQNKFERIQEVMGMTDKGRDLVLSINKANDPTKKYREVYIELGSQLMKVYRFEPSPEQYYAYSTEQVDKLLVEAYTRRLGGDIQKGLAALVADLAAGKLTGMQADKEEN